MAILVIAEHDEGALKSGTLNAITAATQLGPDVTVLVASDAGSAVAAEAAKVAGVTRVLAADAPHYGRPTAENMAALV
ncbi:MAG: electron transfer flavoprotein subunit alpha/FixB family protein, partial [Burkholderiaceae bacterium]